MTDKESILGSLENMEKDIYIQHADIVEPTGDYYAECYEAINFFTSMVDKETKNEKVGFIVNAGKNEDAIKAFYKNTKAQAEKNLVNLGFPVYSVSVTQKVNEELEMLLKKFGGNSFNMVSAKSIARKYGFDVETLDMLDSDGDGLYDTYEINGMRIQNGTVAYTDPKKADTDGDGINDFDELGGLPQELINTKDNFVTTINYQKSDPNDAQSTGRKLEQGYMIVDSIDYLPYDKDTYERIYINDTGEIDSKGNTIYGLYNIYNSNPEALHWVTVAEILAAAEIQCSLAEVGKETFSESRTFLKRYIENKDDRNFYDCGRVLQTSKEARKIWAENVYHLMLAAEGCLDENETIILTQTPENQNLGIDFSIQGKAFWESVNNYVAIHSSKVRSVAEVSYDGNVYTMNLKFYIFDYYDWDKNNPIKVGLVSPWQLYQVCRCGKARFYENWGRYETQLIWKPTEEDRDSVLQEEKDNMQEIRSK